MDNRRRQEQGHSQLDMKLRLCNRNEAAMTRLEVVVVIAVVIIVGLMMLAVFVLPGNISKARKITCTNHLMQIGMSYRIWEGDHGREYPMFVSITNGGSLELVHSGDVLRTFMVMSNEISAPQILHCPADLAHVQTKTFDRLSNSNISYFIGVDATEANPQGVLTGDSNLEINGKPVKSGLVSVWTNDVVSWQPNRHGKSCNIGMTDGSVQSATTQNLQIYFEQTGFATNRLAIP